MPRLSRTHIQGYKEEERAECKLGAGGPWIHRSAVSAVGARCSEVLWEPPQETSEGELLGMNFMMYTVRCRRSFGKESSTTVYISRV